MKKIAILGPTKTYSDLCYHQFVGQTGLSLEPVYFKNMQQVISHATTFSYAIMPFENTLEGYVQPHMDLLLDSGLAIDCELRLPIDFDFVYKGDMATGNLYVQYATKNQCLKFIEQYPNLKVIITESNVDSYHQYQADPSGNAIVPSHLTQASDLTLKGVADESHNHTRFLVLKNQSVSLKRYQPKLEFKVSLVITPYQDRPGLLYDILKEFSSHSVNLISIMSRPTKKQMGNYHFFIELLSADTQYETIILVIENLKKDFDVKVLGIYQVLE